MKWVSLYKANVHNNTGTGDFTTGLGYHLCQSLIFHIT
jgi:hypothetical protein